MSSEICKTLKSSLMCNDMALNKESHTVSNSHSIINSFKFCCCFSLQLHINTCAISADFAFNS